MPCHLSEWLGEASTWIGSLYYPVGWCSSTLLQGNDAVLGPGVHLSVFEKCEREKYKKGHMMCDDVTG